MLKGFFNDLPSPLTHAIAISLPILALCAPILAWKSQDFQLTNDNFTLEIGASEAVAEATNDALYSISQFEEKADRILMKIEQIQLDDPQVSSIAEDLADIKPVIAEVDRTADLVKDAAFVQRTIINRGESEKDESSF